MTALFFQTGAALCLVVLLILAVGAGLRRRRPAGGGLVQLLSYQALGPRKGVAALRVGREVLVVGVTNTDVRLLAQMKEADLPAEPVLQAAGTMERLRKIRERLDG